jgi:segregation and condensation protein B
MSGGDFTVTPGEEQPGPDPARSGRPARRPLGMPGRPRPGERSAQPGLPLTAQPTDAGIPEQQPVAPPLPQQSAAPHATTANPANPAVAPATAADEAPEVSSLPLAAALEAILMVVDEPATEARLASVLERPRHRIAAALRELSAEYTRTGRGFDLRLVAGGWRFYSRAECAPAVDRFVLDGQQARLTQAALETLAVVAYRQPVSRSRVSAVRGVNCDGVMRTLVQRGLVEETGSEPETGAILYRTTNYFLERMGLRGLDELPELAPFLPEADDVEAESLEGSAVAEAVAAVRVADAGGAAGPEGQ